MVESRVTGLIEVTRIVLFTLISWLIREINMVSIDLCDHKLKCFQLNLWVIDFYGLLKVRVSYSTERCESRITGK